MTRLINAIALIKPGCSLITGLFLLLFSSLQAQDLYDIEHSRIYAKHLYEDGRYAWAADEYGRLIRTTPDTQRFSLQLNAIDSLKLLFLKASRLSGQWERSYKSVKINLPNIHSQKQQVAEEYVKLMLSAGYLEDADKEISRLVHVGPKYMLHKSLLEQNWEEAQEIFLGKSRETYPEPTDTQYSILLQRALHLPHRSPALAAGMSAIVPGSGKLYAGEWKDALLSFFFVAFSTYESVHAFKIAGPGSYLGYIYGGMAAGFYGGSIYGSYKSAKRFNTRQNEMILEDAKAIIFSTY
jgi:hypothetical protein